MESAPRTTKSYLCKYFDEVDIIRPYQRGSKEKINSSKVAREGITRGTTRFQSTY